LAPESQLSRKPKTWFNRKSAFYVGIFCGTMLGGLLSTGSSFLYLLFSQDSVSVKRDGNVQFSKETTVATQSTNIPISGQDNPITTGGSAATTGDNSPAAVNPENSLNSTNSPSITGNYNNINIFTPVDKLPGFNREGYPSETTLPSFDQMKYSKVSDFQPEMLVLSTSDTGRINFGNKEITIEDRLYNSFFSISQFANESRFVFRLNGMQKAALFQFGIPDLASKGSIEGKYIIKIISDGEILWAGECSRIEGNQGNQIVSVPLELVGKETVTIEVDRKGTTNNNSSRLFFTEAQIWE
jgi:hypothetical protein